MKIGNFDTQHFPTAFSFIKVVVQYMEFTNSIGPVWRITECQT
jgi:hypothetical protein